VRAATRDDSAPIGGEGELDGAAELVRQQLADDAGAVGAGWSPPAAGRRSPVWFEAKDCTIPAGCETLIAELTTPTYDFTVNGKKIVEAKRDLKRRGLASPDLADAFLLTFAGIPRSRQIERHRRQHEPARSWQGA
jgi:hypothetical protein